MKTITAAQANRQFSAVLRDVAQGESVLITSHGKPVATIVPVSQGRDEAREKAKRKLLKRLGSIPPSNMPRDWTRDDLYDD